jgi:tetratricopeptide (TPR) repeat protein
MKAISRARYGESIPLYERALALVPDTAEAKAELADMVIQRVRSGMSPSPAADIARAEGLVDQALAASPRSPIVHVARAQVLRLGRNRCREAIAEYEEFRAFNPYATSELNGLRQCKLYTGAPEEAISALEQAIRLRPLDQQIGVLYFQMERVHLLQSRVDEAIYWLEKARSAMPEPVFVHAFLAAAYGLKGDAEHAALELEEARRLGGKGSLPA